VYALYNNNNNDNQDNVYSAIVYGKTIVWVHASHLNECEPMPRGSQIVDQAANLTSWVCQ